MGLLNKILNYNYMVTFLRINRPNVLFIGIGNNNKNADIWYIRTIYPDWEKLNGKV